LLPVYIFGERNKTQWGMKGSKKHEHMNELCGAGGDKERWRVGGQSDEPHQTRAHGY